MTSTKTNLIIFVAMILSASSLFSSIKSLKITNNHVDHIWVLLKKKNEAYGVTHAIRPEDKLVLSYENCKDNAGMTCEAIMTGPSIFNFITIPLDPTAQEQSITFEYNDEGQLKIHHNAALIRIFTKHQNQASFRKES